MPSEKKKTYETAEIRRRSGSRKRVTFIDQSNALFLSLSFCSTEARKITAGHETEEIIEFVVGLHEIQLFLKAGTEAAGTVT